MLNEYEVTSREEGEETVIYGDTTFVTDSVRRSNPECTATEYDEAVDGDSEEEMLHQ
jgi:hypothetical protein